MTLALTLAAVSIAFPKAGSVFDHQTRVYMIGATTGGETNLVIQGRNVAVHPNGGWVTMLDLHAGTNSVTVGGSNHWFVVKAKPKPKKAKPGAATNAAPRKVYRKLEYAADLPQLHPQLRNPPLKLSEATIVIDAGHGDHDTGALGPHSKPEKEANLAIAKIVRDELVRKGCHVILTRDDDTFVNLYDRPKIAHAMKADCFVSIHHNAPPTDRDPRLVRYHSVYAWNEIGACLARAINLRMAAAFGPTLNDKGVLRANFAVMRNPEIPSCLIEVDFITTPEGEEDCWNAERQRRVGSAIAAGVADWFTMPMRPPSAATSQNVSQEKKNQ